eukprot:6175058-Pleurochrysis_carterae.AAC.2
MRSEPAVDELRRTVGAICAAVGLDESRDTVLLTGETAQPIRQLIWAGRAGGQGGGHGGGPDGGGGGGGGEDEGECGGGDGAK